MDGGMRLKGKVAVITGAGRGIGRAAGILFANQGARVVLVDIDRAGGEETLRKIRESGKEAIFIPADISKTDQVKAVFRATVKKFSALHILYNNAGIFLSDADQRATEIKEKVWDRIISVNLKGTFLCCKYGIPEIIKSGGGSVINTSSSAGIVGVPGCDAYTATKGAIIALTRSLAVEYGPKVRVNCVVPCAVEKAMNSQSAVKNPNFDEKRFLAMTPARRYGRPEEIAKAALFLASDEASYCYGAVLVVDGGVTIRNMSY
jgi:NAD(P)-dependent dehydrogenase (short-subunit alcohol dehydrogenase family)